MKIVVALGFVSQIDHKSSTQAEQVSHPLPNLSQGDKDSWTRPSFDGLIRLKIYVITFCCALDKNDEDNRK